MEAQVVEKKGRYEIIKLGMDRYCVRKTYKNIFGFTRKTFMEVGISATAYTHHDLVKDVTICETLERAQYIMAANLVREGVL